MVTQEKLSGSWNELKGRVESKWGDITEDEWMEVQGSFDQLVGLIQQRTGEAREEIERTIHAWSEETGRMYSQATAAAQEYAQQAMDSAKQQLGNAQEMVKRHPAESVLVSFGTGVLLGVVLGLISRSR